MYSKRQRCLVWKYKPLDVFEKFLLNELQVLKFLRDPSPEELGAAVVFSEHVSLDFSKNTFILHSHTLPASPFLWQQ